MRSSIITIISLALVLTACGDRQVEKGGVTRGQVKADGSSWQVDPALSCAGVCGQLVADPTAGTYCGCDDACAGAQDCCADKQATCDAAPAPTPTCDYTETPERKYIGQSVQSCAAMAVQCEAGWGYFEDDCGCGCKKQQPTCDYTETPERRYVGQSVQSCAAMLIQCEAGWGYFEDDCGCGCDKQPGAVTLTTDKLDYQHSVDQVTATLSNGLAEPIYLEGCVVFWLEQKVGGSWTKKQPGMVCFWEGYAQQVDAASDRVETIAPAPDAPGTWRVAVDYKLGCATDQPLSACAGPASTVTSAELTVQ